VSVGDYPYGRGATLLVSTTVNEHTSLPIMHVTSLLIRLVATAGAVLLLVVAPACSSPVPVGQLPAGSVDNASGLVSMANETHRWPRVVVLARI
jgi:hypothetical protein